MYLTFYSIQKELICVFARSLLRPSARLFIRSFDRSINRLHFLDRCQPLDITRIHIQLVRWKYRYV